MKFLRSKILPPIVLVLIVLSVFPVRWYVRKHRFEQGYAVVQDGDSKQTVIAHLGQPGEIIDCYHPEWDGVLNKECSKEFWYYSFMERWGFSFNKDGKLIHKTYNVSY